MYVYVCGLLKSALAKLPNKISNKQRDQSFSAYKKFSEKLIFLTLDTHTDYILCINLNYIDFQKLLRMYTEVYFSYRSYEKIKLRNS